MNADKIHYNAHHYASAISSLVDILSSLIFALAANEIITQNGNQV